MGVMGTDRLAVQLGEYRTVHEFLVAEELLVPVIIGVDFLSRHSVILDYSNQTVRIRIGAQTISTREQTPRNIIQVLATLSVQLLNQKVTQLKSVQCRSLGKVRNLTSHHAFQN